MFGLAKKKPEELSELARLAKDPAEDYLRLSPTRPPRSSGCTWSWQFLQLSQDSFLALRNT